MCIRDRPIPTLSVNSPIRPGSGLGNIAYIDSDSFSNYNALWFTMRKALSHGVQVNSTYTWSKSQDLNSLGSQGTYSLENNLNPRGDYGLSDFDARNHFVFSGTWNLPFHGNRLADGWLLANITQLQSGNPLNVVTTSTYNGVSGTMRPTLIGSYSTGRGAVLGNGNVSYIQGTACATPIAGCAFYAQPTGFGTLRRNALTGPGFADTDVSLEKTTRIEMCIRDSRYSGLSHPNMEGAASEVLG